MEKFNIWVLDDRERQGGRDYTEDHSTGLIFEHPVISAC